MALFFKDNSDKKQSDDDAVSVADGIFSEEYKNELRELGRSHLKRQIEDSSQGLKSEIDTVMGQVAVDLKEYMKSQLDVTIAGISKEIMDQMHERISEFNRITRESEVEVTDSLHKNSQEASEKFQRLSGQLQQVVASHEVMMLTAVQENKTRLEEAGRKQDESLKSLNEAAEQSKQKSRDLGGSLEQAIEDQSNLLKEVYRENIDRVAETKKSQEESLQSLKQATDALQGKYDELSQLLDKTVAEQKQMIASTINDNMARIVEHYLITAFGESSDIKAQLPTILAHMEASKTDMVEDMKL